MKVSRATARAALLAEMERISDDGWCAGWMHDLEYDLWAATLAPRSTRATEAGLTTFLPAYLRGLATTARGWWMWSTRKQSAPVHRRFVSLARWRKFYAAWAKRRAAK